MDVRDKRGHDGCGGFHYRSFPRKRESRHSLLGPRFRGDERLGLILKCYSAASLDSAPASRSCI